MSRKLKEYSYFSLMRYLYLLVILFSLQGTLPGQSKSPLWEKLMDTTNRKNTFIYGQIGFHFPVASNFCTAGHGINFSLGVNPAYLFSKKWVIGFFAGLKWKEFVGWPGKFDPTFTFDLKNASRPGTGSAHDSLLVSYYVGQTTIRQQLGGLGYGQLGFIFGNSEIKYLPFVKIFRSWAAWSIEGYMYDGVYTYDFLYLTTQKEYGVALSWTLHNGEYRRLTIGPYFNWAKFQTLNLQGLWLHEFVRPEFAAKYADLWRTGITISLEYF